MSQPLAVDAEQLPQAAIASGVLRVAQNSMLKPHSGLSQPLAADAEQLPQAAIASGVLRVAQNSMLKPQCGCVTAPLRGRTDSPCPLKRPVNNSPKMNADYARR
ncbi:MAG: hypothetical protein LBL31_06155, partial [Spirochaetaceae bacterium]|nr:hypothetical protein [Spirochaetaceae bacterium]